MVRKLVLAVAAASALMSSNMAHALGVGDINLRSALNQPLNAEIELLQVRDLSSAEIRPSLASPDDFGRAGIDRDFFLTDLKFTPEVRPDGRAIIRVTSNKPVREPFLNFLMEVKWPSGRVLREFTLLLDPPLYQPTPAAAPSAPPVSTQTQPIINRQPSMAPAPIRPVAAPSGATQASAAAGSGAGQIRANSSDTLWEIAQRHRPEGASVNQTMLAIQDLNPNAFIGNNINQMLSGSTLTLPNAEQAAVRSPAEATNQVAEQNSAWQRGRQVAQQQPAQRQLDAREQATAAPAPASTNNGDSLRLLAGSGEAGGTGAEAGAAEGDSAQLRDSLDRTKEQLDSAEREKAELSERLEDVQGQLDTLQRLLALKDAQLAALQGQLGADQQAGGQAAVAETPVLVPTEQAQESESATAIDETPAGADAASAAASTDDAGADAALNEASTEPAVSEADALAADPAQPVVDEIDSPAEPAVMLEPTPAEPASAEPAEPVATAPVEVAEVDVAEEEGVEATLQRLLQNQTLMLAAGAAALLILLLILMALARRNARREEELSDNFMVGAGAAAVDQSPSDDFNVALASFDAPEDDQSIAQDPLTEADALIAYGKLEEAAEVLRVAIDEEPGRADLRLKLMEVEGLLDNPQGYVAQAEAVKGIGGHDSNIDALNMRFPLMAAALLGAAAVPADDHDAVDLELTEEPTSLNDAPVVEEESVDFDFSDFEADLSSDNTLSLDPEPQAEPAPVSPTEEEPGFDLDFDLEDALAEESQPDSLELGSPAQASESEAVIQSTEPVGFDASDFDLNFNLDETAEADSTPAQAPLDDSMEASLDDDYDLSLTEDMQAEQLLAEFEAMQDDESAGEETAPRVEASVEEFNLSDDDLAGFEEELNASMEAESNEPKPATVAEPEPVADTGTPDLPDALDPFAADLSTEQAMSESMEDEFDFLSGTDECATKLDLARAYIDMGDEEGARDILAEVVDEGNDQQQKDARDMLAQLS